MANDTTTDAAPAEPSEAETKAAAKADEKKAAAIYAAATKGLTDAEKKARMEGTVTQGTQ